MSAPGERRAAIAIVGGGLAGLVAAWRLAQRGVHDVLLLEARPTLGGRILSADAAGRPVDVAQAALDRFDLGPSWFWPALQPELDALVTELGLARLAQHEDGELLVERSAHQPPVRLRGMVGEPPSTRLVGGSGALIAALHTRLDATRVLTGHTLHTLRLEAGELRLDVAGPGGEAVVVRAQQVMLALPPRLAAARLAFEPALPPALWHRWHATPTWMAPHAKYVAVYERPFWREQGLSGGARSGVGPLGEVHDLSMPGGHAALFGFVGVPARVRRQAGEALLRQHCRAQLGRLFGPHAAAPLADALKDWAADPLTATDDDQDGTGQHAPAPPATADDGPWRGRLVGIGSEWSPSFPGYLAGAVDAAERGLRLLPVPPAAGGR